MDFTVGIVSQNIVTQESFIEFRDSRIFTNFETTGFECTPKMKFLEKSIIYQIFKERPFKIDGIKIGTK